MHSFVRNCLFLTMRHRVDEGAMSFTSIAKSIEDISCFALSSSPVLYFRHEGKELFFRECPGLYKGNRFVLPAVERFFLLLGPMQKGFPFFAQPIPIRLKFDREETESFKAYIKERCKATVFIKRLAGADKTAVEKGFFIWGGQSYDAAFFTAFGMEQLPDACRDIAVLFLWYMRGVATAQRSAMAVRSKGTSYFSAVKSIATGIVAIELGLGSTVTEAKPAFLSIDGTTLKGVISERARGVRMQDAKAGKTPSLQRELSNLHLLDTVCFQTDHGINNYNVYDEGGEHFVCAFDNDNPYTFLPTPFVSHSLAGCSPLIVKGQINRPYLSDGTVKALQALDIKGLKAKLKPYLNPLQLWALSRRVRKLRKAIRQGLGKNSLRLLKDGDWSAETVKEETKGSYGSTYLNKIRIED